jgi:hypothetical protein
LIEDGEVGRESGGGPEFPEEAVGDTVKSATVDLLGRRSNESLAAVEHFLGGASGESQEQDPPGRDPPIYKVGDAMNEGTGFP